MAAAGLLPVGLAIDGSPGTVAVPVDRARIVVRSHGARVVITRQPFRMVFTDAVYSGNLLTGAAATDMTDRPTSRSTHP